MLFLHFEGFNTSLGYCLLGCDFSFSLDQEGFNSRPETLIAHWMNELSAVGLSGKIKE